MKKASQNVTANGRPKSMVIVMYMERTKLIQRDKEEALVKSVDGLISVYGEGTSDFDEFFSLERSGVFECLLYACGNIIHALSCTNFQPGQDDLEALLRELFKHLFHLTNTPTKLTP